LSEVQEILKQYVEAVRFPEASGLEVLELLDARSQIAAHEKELGAAEQARLEEADATFLHNAPTFYESLGRPGRVAPTGCGSLLALVVVSREIGACSARQSLVSFRWPYPDKQKMV